MVNSSPRILVPTDFSACSTNALKHAHTWGKSLGGQIHLLHVASSLAASGPIDKIHHQLSLLAATLDSPASSDHHLEVLTQVVMGDPYKSILHYAKEQQIDYIVIGTHGRTGFAHLTLGSVAERVIRDAPCPVMVLGPGQRVDVAPQLQAATLLTEQFGFELVGERVTELQKMEQFLSTKLKISMPMSTQLLQQLQDRHFLLWEDGPPCRWKLGDLTELEAEASPAVKLVQSDSPATDLIQRASQLRATDIHIDPISPHQSRIRLRIDGELEEYCRLDHHLAETLINRIKTLARLDISEPFLPKEGRVRLPASMSDIEVRLTVAPVADGEAVAMRLFNRESIFLPLESLGLSEKAQGAIEEMSRLREGLMLVTGPTGSGKSTTVYSMLESMSALGQAIVSIEDPVEFSVPFVRQLEVDEKHGVTMTKGLQTILRMDPDIVFLGEVRGPQAAEIAMRSAASGKYVLSTLHTRDVASTVTTLRDMGISDRSMSANLTGIINQRLIRKLCESCREPVASTPVQRDRFSDSSLPAPDQLYLPRGCRECRFTGFRGREGVFEVALMQKQLSNAIAGGASEQQLTELLRAGGTTSLLCDALSKAARGVTSFQEALGVHWL